MCSRQAAQRIEIVEARETNRSTLEQKSKQSGFKGEKVVAEVGGDLKIESLQDSRRYDAKQQSLGVSVSIGYGKVGGSVSASQSKVSSDYLSVVEQSGLQAGDGGFDVKVKGDTELKGGAITSTQKAVDEGKNHFETGGALTMSDLQNKAEYSAKSVSVNVGGGTSFDGKLTPGGSGAGLGKDSGQASSTTVAGISGIAGNKDVRTGDPETGIKPIFDAHKVQKEIEAQVQITQKFGEQAGKAVEEYSQSQMQALRKEYAAATDPAEKKALQERVDALRLETQVMNVLIGAVTGMGGTALTQETLSAAAEEMRKITIENSSRFKGVIDDQPDKPLSNTTGTSTGGKWDLDPFKTGGQRLDLDVLCGADNKRCVTQRDSLTGDPLLDDKGVPKLELKNGYVQWDREGSDGKSLSDWLKTDEGKKLAGATGGIQGWKGTLFGSPYAAGSWQDKLIEAFGGTHDFIGGQVSGLYDEQGNAKRGMSNLESKAYDVWSGVAILPASPFAAATLLPPEVWKGIAIFLKAAK